jgi:hypothetical protein
MKKCQPVTLTPYLDGELNDDMRRDIDQHLQSCASCGSLLEQLTDASRQVRSMGRAAIPAAALKPALEIITERSGLNPSPGLAATTEVARATPTVEVPTPEAEAEAPTDELPVSPEVPTGAFNDAWAAGSPAPPPAVAGIPDDEYWGQKTSTRPDSAPADAKPATGNDSTPADAEPVTADDAMTADAAPATTEEEPTWVKPEPWMSAPEPEVAEAKALGTEDGMPAAEREPELPMVETDAPAGPVDHLEALEEHPSPPPPEIRPPWMEAPAGDDDDLEEAGRRAVDEAIVEDQNDSPTASEEAAEEVPERGVPAGATDDGQEPHRGWLSSLFERRQDAAAIGATELQPGDEAEAAEPALEPEPAAEPAPDAEREAAAESREEPEGTATLEPVPETEALDEPEAIGTAAGTPEAALDESNVAAFRTGMAAVDTPTFDFGPGGEPDRPDTPDQTPEEPEPAAAMSDSLDDPGQIRGYREALLGARDEPPPPARGLSSLNTQLKVGLLGVLGIILLVTALLLMNQRPQPSTTASSGSSQPSAASHPSPPPTPSHSSAPTPAPSAASTAPTTAQLTEVVTAGAGGSGWHVARIRIGSPNPATGITRVVFDLEGAGPPADAQLGRGSDGAIYLTAPGINISPATVAGFSGAGAITGISQTGSQGLALRLATNGKPGFSIGYLNVPTRLVLDFK